MKTIKFFSFIAMLLIGMSISAQTTRTLDNFSTIAVSGDIAVEVVKSSTSKADITIQKGEIDALITEVSGGKLNIKFAKESSNSWGGGAKAQITLYTNKLERVDASAGAAVESDDNWNSKNITVETSSGARIYLTTTSGKAKAEASSGSRITLLGQAESFTVSCSSGANIDASGLESQRVKAECSSGGAVKVHAITNLEAEASSGGSIKYKGNPSDTDIQKDKYSGGNVSPM